MSAPLQYLVEHAAVLHLLPLAPRRITAALWDPTAPPPNGGGGGVDVPDAPPAAPPNLQAPVEMLIGWGKWGVLVCGMAGLLMCAGKMTIGQRNRANLAADGASGIPWVLGGLSLASVAAGLITIVYGTT
ncbi:hypothetical protein AB0C84_40385 [Actinomadura sp. NPDC048955]|uniref:hypothetical protein n=1 Tax=Actinomadura sp. NPDC048955 TaxID=3158228 RepID=UPI0033F71299